MRTHHWSTIIILFQGNWTNLDLRFITCMMQLLRIVFPGTRRLVCYAHMMHAVKLYIRYKCHELDNQYWFNGKCDQHHQPTLMPARTATRFEHCNCMETVLPTTTGSFPMPVVRAEDSFLSIIPWLLQRPPRYNYEQSHFTKKKV